MSTVTPSPAPAPAPAPAPVAPPAPGSPEHDAALLARADEALGTTPPAAPEAPARPEWLPEKFKGPEDLAKAYQALEAKLAAGNPPAAPATPPAGTPAPAGAAPTGDSAALDWSALTTEYSEKGALSETTLADLDKRGFPRAVVDSYIEGQKALAAKYDAAAYEVAGGQEQFASMTTWAKSNLPQAEQIAFDNAVGSGDVNVMKLAVAGLAARYGAASPSLVRASAPAGGDAGYASMAEMKTDMANPLYQRDPAFRAKVSAKAAVTTTF